MYTIELDGVVCYAPNNFDLDYLVFNPEYTAEINQADVLTFTMPVTNPSYGSLTPLGTSVTLREVSEEGNSILCHGRVLSVSHDYYNNLDVVCEGALAWLNDVPIAPHTYNGTVAGYRDMILAEYNTLATANRKIGKMVNGTWQYGQISNVDSSDYSASSTVTGYTINGAYYTIEQIARQVIAGQWGVGNTRRLRLEAAGCCFELIQNKVNELLGVSFRYQVDNTGSSSSSSTINIVTEDYQTALECLTADWLTEQNYTIFARSEDDGGIIVSYVDFMSKNGSMGDQIVEFGRNMLDFNETLDASDFYTCVIPLGKSTDDVPLTIETVNPTGEIYLENTSLSAVHGKIYRIFNHSEIENAAELKTAGEKDLKDCDKNYRTITVQAVDLTLTGESSDAFQVGVRNRILSAPHGYGMNDNTEYLICNRATINLQDPTQSVYEFGVNNESLTEQLSKG